MRAHRFKLGERVIVDPEVLDIDGTITRLAFHLDPFWECPSCGTECPGPWYAVASTNGVDHWTDVWAEHDLRRLPQPKPTTQGATR